MLGVVVGSVSRINQDIEEDVIDGSDDDGGRWCNRLTVRKIYRKTIIKSIYASTILKMGGNGWPIAVN